MSTGLALLLLWSALALSEASNGPSHQNIDSIIRPPEFMDIFEIMWKTMENMINMFPKSAMQDVPQAVMKAEKALQKSLANEPLKAAVDNAILKNGTNKTNGKPSLDISFDIEVVVIPPSNNSHNRNATIIRTHHEAVQQKSMDDNVKMSNSDVKALIAKEANALMGKKTADEAPAKKADEKFHLGSQETDGRSNKDAAKELHVVGQAVFQGTNIFNINKNRSDLLSGSAADELHAILQHKSAGGNGKQDDSQLKQAASLKNIVSLLGLDKYGMNKSEIYSKGISQLLKKDSSDGNETQQEESWCYTTFIKHGVLILILAIVCGISCLIGTLLPVMFEKRGHRSQFPKEKGFWVSSKTGRILSLADPNLGGRYIMKFFKPHAKEPLIA